MELLEYTHNGYPTASSPRCQVYEYIYETSRKFERRPRYVVGHFRFGRTFTKTNCAFIVQSSQLPNLSLRRPRCHTNALEEVSYTRIAFSLLIPRLPNISASILDARLLAPRPTICYLTPRSITYQHRICCIERNHGAVVQTDS